jgi:hypothetical protein
MPGHDDQVAIGFMHGEGLTEAMKVLLASA